MFHVELAEYCALLWTAQEHIFQTDIYLFLFSQLFH